MSGVVCKVTAVLTSYGFSSSMAIYVVDAATGISLRRLNMMALFFTTNKSTGRLNVYPRRLIAYKYTGSFALSELAIHIDILRTEYGRLSPRTCDV